MNKFSRKPPTTADEFLGQAAMSVTDTKEASTVVAEAVAPVQEVAKPAKPAKLAKVEEKEEDESVYKTLTLRLNKTRYKRLKMLSTMSEESIQVLLTEALDDYMPKKEKSEGIR